MTFFVSLPLILVLLASTAIHSFSVNFSKLNPLAPQNDAPLSTSSTNDTKEASKLPAAPLSSIGSPSTSTVVNSNAKTDSTSAGLSRNQHKRSCCCCNCCCCKCCPCCCCCPCQCGESCWKWTPCCCCPCCCGCVGYGRRKMMRCRRNSTKITNIPATKCTTITFKNEIGFNNKDQNLPANAPGKKNE